MDLFGLGSMAQAVGNSIVGGLNYKAQKDYNEKTLQLNREQFEYEKQLQQKMFEREDNAVRRKMNDLAAAGLNPIFAASGEGAGAGAVVGGSSLTANQSGAAQISGIEGAMEGIINALSAKQNISLSRTQEALIDKQIETEAERPEQVRAETENTKSDTSKKRSEKRNIDEDTKRIGEDIKRIRSDTLKKDAERQNMIADMQLKDTHREIEEYNYWLSRQLGMRTTEGMPNTIFQAGHYNSSGRKRAKAVRYKYGRTY